MTSDEILLQLTPIVEWLVTLETPHEHVAVKDDADFKALLTRVIQLQAAVATNRTNIAKNVSTIEQQTALIHELVQTVVSVRERVDALEAEAEEPTDPTEPTDPLDPEEPKEPEEPVDPPTDPEEPPVEEPEPEEPTDPEEPVDPEPEVPVFTSVSAKVNAFTDTNTWNKGTYREKAGVSIPYNAETDAAFKVGTHVELADGQVRRINYRNHMDGNMSIFFDGPQIDPLLVGSPQSVKTTEAELNVVDYVPPVVPEEPVPEEPTPEEPEQPEEPVDPIPPVTGERKGVMGTALGMGMGKPQVVPGEIRYDFELPKESDIDRAVSYEMRLFRVGSLRERIIKPGGNSELYLGTHTSQFGGQKPRSLPEIRNFCKLAASKGCKVMLDIFHNYGGFSEGNNAAKDNNPQHKKIGTEGGPSYDMFANDWKSVIEYLKQDPQAWAGVYGCDLMNEWVGLPSDNVFYATQRFLDVCGPIMDDKLAIIEGNAYSNTPNFAAHNPRFKDLVDPRGPGFIEMSGHLYSDQDMSGMYTTPDAYKAGTTVGPHGLWYTRAEPFLDYCEQHGFKASIGEWIVPGDYPFLLADAERGIPHALARGCNVIVFGMGTGYASNAHHNLEIERNKPTLEVVKRLAAL